MREIKFRAWDGEEMLYEGFHISAPGTSWKWEDYTCKNSVQFQVPIMQYTNLKDKNDIEIYEGDILKSWYSRDVSGTDIINVTITVEHEITHEGSGFEIPFLSEAQVIGNIYQNPELLNA